MLDVIYSQLADFHIVLLPFHYTLSHRIDYFKIIVRNPMPVVHVVSF